MKLSLPMYLLPGMRPATEAWAEALVHHLGAAGFNGVDIVWDQSAETLWRAPDLLLSQSCGYPLTHGFSDALQPVATPSYGAEGCIGRFYSSRVIVSEKSGATALEDLRGTRSAVNGFDSQSGWAALCADLLESGLQHPVFSEIRISGSHHGSLKAVQEGQADVAALDAVTYALLERSGLTTGVRTLGFTRRAPALPYVTRRDASPETVAALQAALEAAVKDPEMADARTALLLQGLSPATREDYREIAEQPSAAPETMAERIIHCVPNHR